MSRLKSLLTQKEPLEAHEVSDLKEWLSEMQADCENFGPTPDDLQRMGAIADRITAESN